MFYHIGEVPAKLSDVPVSSASETNMTGLNASLECTYQTGSRPLEKMFPFIPPLCQMARYDVRMS